MFKSEMNASLRNEIGSNACNRIRNMGYIPGVVYGQHTASQTLEIDKSQLDNIIRNHGLNVMVNLYLNEEQVTVMLKDVQRDPVTKEIVHVDFQEITQNEMVNMMVPVTLIGKSKVESKEGIVQQQLREIYIECLPENIPSSIQVDVSNISPGHPLRVADVEFGQELSVLNDSNEIIAALAKVERAVDNNEEENDLLSPVPEINPKTEGK